MNVQIIENIAVLYKTIYCPCCGKKLGEKIIAKMSLEEYKIRCERMRKRTEAFFKDIFSEE